MDCAEIRVEMAEEGPLVPLIITEQGDVTEGVAEGGPASRVPQIAHSFAVDLSPKEAEERRGEENDKDNIIVGQKSVEERSMEKQHTDTENGKTEGEGKDGIEKLNDGQEGGERERRGQADGVVGINERSEKACDTADEKVAQDDPQPGVKRLHFSEIQPREAQNSEEDQKKAHRLTPDFPDALYELLCTLQEGRRLNDQRCSFRLEGGVTRRRCHSEPNTTKPANRVIFSSMTSLQREEFFELVATAQARRLDDQRALFGRSPPPKSRARSFRGSIKQLSLVRKPAPVPVPKEDLYNMILTTQAQGRLEDQRSRAPGPMDDEDFFSLLLRVQGGRMEEQRTELPRMLQT